MQTVQLKEWQEQTTVIDWIKKIKPWLINHTIFIGNERKCSGYIGNIYNKMGRLEGVSDLFIAWPNTKHHGLFIEMKSKKGRATKPQLEFIERMNNTGYYACVCKGADEAINIITIYLNNN